MAVGNRRRPRLIQETLDTHRTTAKALSREIGLSYSVVLETISGKRNNRKVLRHLLQLGVQPQYLDLPHDLQEQG